ncbi:transcriptional regulator [Mycolicibacterium parafortuitum]|uniref:Transcriptional regulator n=1 Tax=Mycolicibacterium parafortuitum TaxID=39692 RepID=A0A7I7U0N7_MYCPF|nr:transcriptional regulator [Mycolicibacterium parafortuitum]BBY74415.1 transcriptional regulator [Mycolicibacterium parafortuitum]
MTNAEPIDGAIGAPDPGMVRAGSAAAARRRELNISQRSLAAQGIINAGALIAFEKGRSWPRERTRARLEEILQWPSGAIAALRRGEPVRTTSAQPAQTLQPSGDEVSLIAQAVITAVHAFDATVAALPGPDDDTFIPRVTAILTDLRQLEAVASRAARIGRVTPTLIKALSTVRGLYDDLMMRAARAPRATLGHRLYAARRRANLTVLETAQAAGVSEQAIEHSEAGEPISQAEAAAIEALISQI